MSDRVTLTPLQAQRALALAVWMAGRPRDARTRKRVADLVRALEAALDGPDDEYRERRRAEWRQASAHHRARKKQETA